MLSLLLYSNEAAQPISTENTNDKRAASPPLCASDGVLFVELDDGW